MATPANNQCRACGLFTTSPTGYCNNCTQSGRAPHAPPIGAGPPSDSVIIQRTMAPSALPVSFGLKRLRSDAEIERTEHPDQRIVSGDANIRFAGRDPDIFDRIHNLCKAMRLVADELRLEVRSTFVAGPMGETTAITRAMPGEHADVADRRKSLVKLMQLISDDLKKYSQKDGETWALIKRMRNLSIELETFLDMGGEPRTIVLGLRELASDLKTNVEQRKGF